MKKLLVVQHVEKETLGNLEKEIRLQKLEYEILETYKNPYFPSGKELEEKHNALILLGGPQSVTEINKYGWMQKELLLIREALRQKMPVLGVCLGSQLLARAAGAQVKKGPKREIGWGQIKFDDWFSKRNPLTFQLDLARRHTVFHWHGDTFDLPVEGYRLAWNENYPFQMFCYQGNAVGIQFHPEMTEAMIKKWATSDRDELRRLGIDPEKILDEIPTYLPDLEGLCHKFFYGFATLIRENVRRAA
ncbi:MAG: gamma-glutamyl-gamma-aminobutyrate hydrolase family protein [Deltaproteobacteria bacterium]|nr:gamma-glutamyl-gamma-aminobutyrate hydrolase family protein [Deltaproteobacteria bacterium]MBI4373889.1 gamma-glutamyl-gamma-aminobutyrate hydrolase family protein [Deltaproteobacteria bacterium]